MRRLRILVACECSGRVRRAFAERGWEAWSADLLPSETTICYPQEGTGVEHHYQGDVRELFSPLHPVNHDRRKEQVRTLRTTFDSAPPLWDLVIAHPPCDHLSLAGARWWKEKQADGRQDAAMAFFLEMYCAPSPLVCIENPRGYMNNHWREPSQIVEPWWFGDAMSKKTCLWFRGSLPQLVADNPVEPTGRVATGGGSWRTDKAAERHAMSAYEDSEGRKNRAKVRSRTFPGFARAMADQWGPWVEEYYAERSGTS